MRAQGSWIIIVAFSLVACSKRNLLRPEMPSTSSNNTRSPAGDIASPMPGEIAPPEAQPPEPAALPAGASLEPAAPFDSAVTYVPNRSSVTLFLPYETSARDYRVFALRDGVTIEIDAQGREVVSGATIYCAGLRQQNACDDSEAVTEYGLVEEFYTAPCDKDVRASQVQKSVVRQIEVNGITSDTVLVVEALDALCPFVGARGNAHSDVPIFLAELRPVSAVYDGRLGQFPYSRNSFPVVTNQEVLEKYKSIIVNGHASLGRSSDPALGPQYEIGQPSPSAWPHVLKRAVIRVTPTGTTSRPDGFSPSDIFDDFSNDQDTFSLVKARSNVEGVLLPQGFGPIGGVKLFANSTWNWFTANAAAAQVFIENGVLRSVLADEAQDVMASSVFYPKRPIQLPTLAERDRFVHVTLETPTNATQRRYWWWHACGAETLGKTYSGTAITDPKGIVATPFFMNTDGGGNVSTAGWNCIQIVPRGGSYEMLIGGEVSPPNFAGRSRAQTDLRMIINKPRPEGTADDQSSVLSLDPSQIPGDTQAVAGAWSRPWNDTHELSGTILDDQMFIEQRTRIDIYFNRTRIVFFANGKQKACDDFAAHPLTMAEAAVGFGHVIYHSSAERTELLGEQWIRTAQQYYRWNTPFVDGRNFDNVGIAEDAALPASFNPAPCFVTP
jgi:hypothetical protein